MAYALPFVARPTLQVRSTDAGNTETKTYTYTDAISKYGHLLKQIDLGEAYRRAGNFFKGQLEQQFIVLKESGAGPMQAQQQQQPQRPMRGHPNPQPGGSRKRTRDDEDDHGSHGWYEPTPPGRGSGGYEPTPPGRGRGGYRRSYRGNKYSRR